MFSLLKKHFIPHEGNEHRPHLLRGSNMRNVVVFVLLLEIFTFLLPILNHLNTKGGMAAVLPAVLASLTNEERQVQNLQTLTINSTLNKAAEMKAQDMATLGYFAHTSPEGKTPWYWLEKVGYNYQYAGENLAINFSDSKDVTDAWMASPTHKANIVKENYTEVGTGIATGIYEGRETVFVAQVYANPLPDTSTQVLNKKNIIRKTEKVITAVKEETANVLGAEVVKNTVNNSPEVETKPAVVFSKDNFQEPTFWQKLIASPRNTTNTLLYFVFGIVLTALLLYFLIKMKNHHKDLITNGLLVLAIIGAVLVVNYYYSHRNMTITDSFNYSNEIK